MTYEAGAASYIKIYSEGDRIKNTSYAYDYGSLKLGSDGTGGLIIGCYPAWSERFSGSVLELQASNVTRTYGWARTQNFNISSLSSYKGYRFYSNAEPEAVSTSDSKTYVQICVKNSAGGYEWLQLGSSS